MKTMSAKGMVSTAPPGSQVNECSAGESTPTFSYEHSQRSLFSAGREGHLQSVANSVT
jgi:hypothetical protein